MAQAQKGTPSLGQTIKGLHRRLDAFEQELKALKDILNTKDNWHAEIKEWIGREVVTELRSGRVFTSVLIWSDRYNICLERGGERIICTKGAIDTIRRA